jgi:hypothetical protein
MTSERESSGGRSMWMVWVLAVMVGLFAFWFVRNRREA